jgi:hypothetical protein
LGQRTGTHGRSVGPSGEWLALTGGLSTGRGSAKTSFSVRMGLGHLLA